MTKIVARHIFAMLHKFDRETAIRAFMVADAQPLDDGTRLEPERLGASDDTRA